MRVVIPKREHIVVTSHEDPVLFYYTPFLGYFYLKRLTMTLDLMDQQRKERVLEIGYGSGVFLLALSKQFKEVHAVDLHSNASAVRDLLVKERVHPKLAVADVFQLPYKTASFDSVVCLSVLEHLESLDRGIEEILRVAKTDGQIIFGIPVESWLMRSSFKLLGYSYKHLHRWNHVQIIDKIREKVTIEKISRFPNLGNSGFSLYLTSSCRKK